MDTEVKRGLDAFCAEVGLTPTAAFNLFARTVVREQRLPFEVTTKRSPFRSEENQTYLRTAISKYEEGQSRPVVKSLSELEEMAGE
jgi:DNA-damage-inducible protein J